MIPALKANAAALKSPAGYGDVAYYAVHAYRWLSARGEENWVRYTWKPAGAVARRRDGERSVECLSEEVRERLPEEPIAFDLHLQIADPGEDPHDPTSQWGDGSRRVIAGRLTIAAVAEGHDGIIFDPLRLTDGIEPSEDPILLFRPKAYAVSYDRRTGAEHTRPTWAR